MSDLSLVVKQGSLADMESALSTAHDAIVKQVHDVLRAGERPDPGLGPGDGVPGGRDGLPAPPRPTGVDEADQALDTVRTKLAEVATEAHEVEVKNVAVVD